MATTATIEAAIRAQIKSTISGVSNTGTVHDYERWSSTWDAMLTLYKTTISGTDYIRGWSVSCASMQQEDETYGDRNEGNLQTFNYVMRGYFGVDDANASEKTAIGIVLNVVDALDAMTTVISAEAITFGPADLQTFEYRLLGSTLCHYAEIRQVLRRYV